MKTLRFLCTGLVVVMAIACIAETASAQTGLGVIEGRAAPVARRKCISGILAGSLCNEDSDCPGSTCVDRNVFNITVAVHFNDEIGGVGAADQARKSVHDRRPSAGGRRPHHQVQAGELGP